MSNSRDIKIENSIFKNTTNSILNDATKEKNNAQQKISSIIINSNKQKMKSKSVFQEDDDDDLIGINSTLSKQRNQIQSKSEELEIITKTHKNISDHLSDKNLNALNEKDIQHILLFGITSNPPDQFFDHQNIANSYTNAIQGHITNQIAKHNSDVNYFNSNTTELTMQIIKQCVDIPNLDDSTIKNLVQAACIDLRDKLYGPTTREEETKYLYRTYQLNLGFTVNSKQELHKKLLSDNTINAIIFHHIQNAIVNQIITNNDPNETDNLLKILNAIKKHFNYQLDNNLPNMAKSTRDQQKEGFIQLISSFTWNLERAKSDAKYLIGPDESTIDPEDTEESSIVNLLDDLLNSLQQVQSSIDIINTVAGNLTSHPQQPLNYIQQEFQQFADDTFPKIIERCINSKEIYKSNQINELIALLSDSSKKYAYYKQLDTKTYPDQDASGDVKIIIASDTQSEKILKNNLTRILNQIITQLKGNSNNQPQTIHLNQREDLNSLKVDEIRYIRYHGIDTQHIANLYVEATYLHIRNHINENINKPNHFDVDPKQLTQFINEYQNDNPNAIKNLIKTICIELKNKIIGEGKNRTDKINLGFDINSTTKLEHMLLQDKNINFVILSNIQNVIAEQILHTKDEQEISKLHNTYNKITQAIKDQVLDENINSEYNLDENINSEYKSRRDDQNKTFMHMVSKILELNINNKLNQLSPNDHTTQLACLKEIKTTLKYLKADLPKLKDNYDLSEKQNHYLAAKIDQLREETIIKTNNIKETNMHDQPQPRNLDMMTPGTNTKFDFHHNRIIDLQRSYTPFDLSDKSQVLAFIGHNNQLYNRINNEQNSNLTEVQKKDLHSIQNIFIKTIIMRSEITKKNYTSACCLADTIKDHYMREDTMEFLEEHRIRLGIETEKQSTNPIDRTNIHIDSFDADSSIQDEVDLHNYHANIKSEHTNMPSNRDGDGYANLIKQIAGISTYDLAEEQSVKQLLFNVFNIKNEIVKIISPQDKEELMRERNTAIYNLIRQFNPEKHIESEHFRYIQILSKTLKDSSPDLYDETNIRIKQYIRPIEIKEVFADDDNIEIDTDSDDSRDTDLSHNDSIDDEQPDQNPQAPNVSTNPFIKGHPRQNQNVEDNNKNIDDFDFPIQNVQPGLGNPPQRQNAQQGLGNNQVQVPPPNQVNDQFIPILNNLQAPNDQPGLGNQGGPGPNVPPPGQVPPIANVPPPPNLGQNPQQPQPPPLPNQPRPGADSQIFYDNRLTTWGDNFVNTITNNNTQVFQRAIQELENLTDGFNEHYRKYPNTNLLSRAIDAKDRQLQRVIIQFQRIQVHQNFALVNNLANSISDPNIKAEMIHKLNVTTCRESIDAAIHNNRHQQILASIIFVADTPAQIRTEIAKLPGPNNQTLGVTIDLDNHPNDNNVLSETEANDLKTSITNSLSAHKVTKETFNSIRDNLANSADPIDQNIANILTEFQAAKRAVYFAGDRINLSKQLSFTQLKTVITNLRTATTSEAIKTILDTQFGIKLADTENDKLNTAIQHNITNIYYVNNSVTAARNRFTRQVPGSDLDRQDKKFSLRKVSGEVKQLKKDADSIIASSKNLLKSAQDTRMIYSQRELNPKLDECISKCKDLKQQIMYLRETTLQKYARYKATTPKRDKLLPPIMRFNEATSQETAEAILNGLVSIEAGLDSTLANLNAQRHGHYKIATETKGFVLAGSFTQVDPDNYDPTKRREQKENSINDHGEQLKDVLANFNSYKDLVLLDDQTYAESTYARNTLYIKRGNDDLQFLSYISRDSSGNGNPEIKYITKTKLQEILTNPDRTMIMNLNATNLTDVNIVERLKPHLSLLQQELETRNDYRPQQPGLVLANQNPNSRLNATNSIMDTSKGHTTHNLYINETTGQHIIESHSKLLGYSITTSCDLPQSNGTIPIHIFHPGADINDSFLSQNSHIRNCYIYQPGQNELIYIGNDPDSPRPFQLQDDLKDNLLNLGNTIGGPPNDQPLTRKLSKDQIIEGIVQKDIPIPIDSQREFIRLGTTSEAAVAYLPNKQIRETVTKLLLSELNPLEKMGFDGKKGNKIYLYGREAQNPEVRKVMALIIAILYGEQAAKNVICPGDKRLPAVTQNEIQAFKITAQDDLKIYKDYLAEQKATAKKQKFDPAAHKTTVENIDTRSKTFGLR